jgi:hypothetical protein
VKYGKKLSNMVKYGKKLLSQLEFFKNGKLDFYDTVKYGVLAIL